MNKKIIFLISSVLIITLALTGATLALLATRSEAKNNSFVPGELDTRIIENEEDPADTKEFTPDDDTTPKEVKVENIQNPHGVDAYIRVMLVPTFRTEEGTLAGHITLQPSEDKVVITGPHRGDVILHLQGGWDNHWFYHNGCFYHRKLVQPGGFTAVLLESVDASDNDLWYSLQLEVLSDAIQGEGGAAQEVWDVTITYKNELTPKN